MILDFIRNMSSMDLVNVVSDAVLLIFVLCRKKPKTSANAVVKSDMQSLIDYHRKTADKLEKLLTDNETETKGE